MHGAPLLHPSGAMLVFGSNTILLSTPTRRAAVCSSRWRGGVWLSTVPAPRCSSAAASPAHCDTCSTPGCNPAPAEGSAASYPRGLQAPAAMARPSSGALVLVLLCLVAAVKGEGEHRRRFHRYRPPRRRRCPARTSTSSFDVLLGCAQLPGFCSIVAADRDLEAPPWRPPPTLPPRGSASPRASQSCQAAT